MVFCGRTPAQAVNSVARPAEALRHICRQLDVVKHDIVVDRGIAEQHVEKLTSIVADSGAGERNAHLEPAVPKVLNRKDPPDSLAQHLLIVDRIERHLHALFDGNGAGTLVNRMRVRAHAVDRFKVQRHGSDQRD
jgi:hypothetical protein